MAFNLNDYEPVEERLRQFWADHPEGRVVTKLLRAEDGDYIVRALVFKKMGVGNDWPTATGLAHDSKDQLPAQMKASALEVCETSAIGRALANMGYAPKNKRPSREEMQKASGSPSAGAGGGTHKDPKPANVDGGGGHSVDSSGSWPEAVTPPPSTSSQPDAGTRSGEGAGGSPALSPVAEAEEGGSELGGSTPPSDATEPHEHKNGKRLASGRYLCSICGDKL